MPTPGSELTSTKTWSRLIKDGVGYTVIMTGVPIIIWRVDLEKYYEGSPGIVIELGCVAMIMIALYGVNQTKKILMLGRNLAIGMALINDIILVPELIKEEKYTQLFIYGGTLIANITVFWDDIPDLITRIANFKSEEVCETRSNNFPTYYMGKLISKLILAVFYSLYFCAKVVDGWMDIYKAVPMFKPFLVSPLVLVPCSLIGFLATLAFMMRGLEKTEGTLIKYYNLMRTCICLVRMDNNQPLLEDNQSVRYPCGKLLRAFFLVACVSMGQIVLVNSFVSSVNKLLPFTEQFFIKWPMLLIGYIGRISVIFPKIDTLCDSLTSMQDITCDNHQLLTILRQNRILILLMSSWFLNAYGNFYLGRYGSESPNDPGFNSTNYTGNSTSHATFDSSEFILETIPDVLNAIISFCVATDAYLNSKKREGSRNEVDCGFLSDSSVPLSSVAGAASSSELNGLDDSVVPGEKRSASPPTPDVITANNEELQTQAPAPEHVPVHFP